MILDEINWNAAYENLNTNFGRITGRKAGSEESRASWDKRSVTFAHHGKRSDYIPQLMELIDLKEGETLFDMGCGSGTLAVPAAKEGHEVIAVDFSSGMLSELEQYAADNDVADSIKVFQRSWQEGWSDLPQADVAVSSRSFVVEDLAEGIAKLEGQARDRAVITIGAGDRPYHDGRIYKAMGREIPASVPPRELAVIVNYLWSIGRYPRVSYLEYPGIWHQDTREELVERITTSHEPENEDQEAALNAYLDEHIRYDEEEGWWTVDYARTDRWAAILWPVPRED